MAGRNDEFFSGASGSPGASTYPTGNLSMSQAKVPPPFAATSILTRIPNGLPSINGQSASTYAQSDPTAQFQRTQALSAAGGAPGASYMNV
jgi:hypothetical protein